MSTTQILEGPTAGRTSPPRQWRVRLKAVASTVFHHAMKHTGVGIVCSVAYFDPGNWGVDLQAGSQFGYKLLFVVLVAGLFGIFFQVLASRLGCVTGLDLASHCRLLLHDRPKHKYLYRWLGLYPLYLLAEIAIISTDLAELLGSAIALCMIFPRLPLWGGVMITALDVMLVLALKDPLQGRPVKIFEVLIAVLVVAVLICMVIILSKLAIDWGDAFKGFLPSKNTFTQGSLYTSVGIIGATVMPHSLFLGSALATQDRISTSPKETSSHRDSKHSLATTYKYNLRNSLNKFFVSFCSAFRVVQVNQDVVVPLRHSDRENNSLSFVRAHLSHGVVNMVTSLLGFAVLINSLILILAAAVFYQGTGTVTPASLFDAHALIGTNVGKPAALLFAIALLAAGQSSSIIATVAGQAVSEGFLQWRVSPVVRRLFTRLIALIPSMVVAIAVGRSGIDALLVASQVVLSIVLPFVTLPLIYLTSSKSIMAVKKPPSSVNPAASETSGTLNAIGRQSAHDAENGQQVVDFSCGKSMTAIGSVIWLVVLTANVYVIVALAMGSVG